VKRGDDGDVSGGAAIMMVDEGWEKRMNWRKDQPGGK
jgi:hypothetical protein